MKFFASLAAAALLCAAAPAYAQADAHNPALGPDGGAATRSVAKYLGLERALQAALAGGRGAALETMVDPDFELRLPASADTRSREQWIKEGAGKAGAGARVRDLAVREADDLALVSFVLESGKARWFVVDAWRQSNDRLQARFIAPAGGTVPRLRKPDGRE